MDGNGRWAAKRSLLRLNGHREGVKRAQEIIEESRRLGIRYLTLFAFSSENWNRPWLEVSGLMKLFEQYITTELQRLCERGIRLRVIGNRDKLPLKLRTQIAHSETKTAGNSEMDLILAISYGGRDEITRAVQLIAQKIEDSTLHSSDVTKELVSKYLFLPQVPEPDLLIRTGGEFRISNFVLWQIAYTELVFSSVLWPEFTTVEYLSCLSEFSHRERRFGNISA